MLSLLKGTAKLAKEFSAKPFFRRVVRQRFRNSPSQAEGTQKPVSSQASYDFVQTRLDGDGPQKSTLAFRKDPVLETPQS